MSKLTQQELESQLCKIVDIFRMFNIEPKNCTKYVMVLLLIKRLSDLFEEEGEKILAETGDRELAWNDPDEHIFYVPEKARWSNLKGFNRDIGNKLNTAAIDLENANPRLKGVLTIANFNDHVIFKGQVDSIFGKIINIVSKLDLHHSEPGLADSLGRIHEYLFLKFSYHTGQKVGYYPVTSKVRELLVRLLNLQEKTRICDPTCNSGENLIECVRHLKHQGKSDKDISLFGQEGNLEMWAMSQINLILNNILNYDIRKGDPITDIAFIEDQKLMLFDLVISNVPILLNKGNEEVHNNDPFGRFKYGIPPKISRESAFIQNTLALLKEQGKACILVSHGVLFRIGSEQKIRQGIIEDDLVEAIIDLPPRAFYRCGIRGAIMILNKNKPNDRKKRVLFIDATEPFVPYSIERNPDILFNEDVRKIVEIYRDFKQDINYSAVVTLQEIANNEYNLNVSSYVVNFEEEAEINLELEIDKLRELSKERKSLEESMNKTLKELDIEI